MTLTRLEGQVPALEEYAKNMPEGIRNQCTVRAHPADSIMHQEDMELGYFRIVVLDENHVINKFESENVYMIEGNKTIDFISEVTILARAERTSVTIEAVTNNVVAYISRRDAERWLAEDMSILHPTARYTAFKLCRSSYNNGARLFYPPSCLLLDYTVRYGKQSGMDSTHPSEAITVERTHRILQEEIGVNVKTLNRTIWQLKEEGFFDLCRGKLIFLKERYRAVMDWLRAAKDKW